jgi:hypothetical protein
MKMTLGLFRIFSKFRGTGINDKFVACIDDTGGKFATGATGK